MKEYQDFKNLTRKAERFSLQRKNNLANYAKAMSHNDYFRFNEHFIHWMFDETPYDRIFISGMRSSEVFEAFPLCSLLSFPFSFINPEEYPSNTKSDLLRKITNLPESNTSHHRHFHDFSESLMNDLRRPYVALQAFVSKLPYIFVKLGNYSDSINNVGYEHATATTFDVKLAHKFLGDFNMDDILDISLDS
uniref:Uncharacterized protein n=1 Tax=Paramoeba aestuarina TaxID=180227 RepID=A0A7S4KMM2_9EUKA|mmetsp:Transcript_21798/g.33871  ORF Transcript_21798/g.33871 Transcript_21798/m.33871 type:complete len:192 (+) Transcript_21798:584-1159(+)